MERDALADLKAEIHLWQGDDSTPVDLAVLRRAAAEIARLRAEVAELRKPDLRWSRYETGQQHERATQADELTALRVRVAGLEGLVRDCQRDLARYLPPDSGISEKEVVGTLLARLDGPQARNALSATPAPDPRDARIAELGGAEDPPTVGECLKLRECMDAISTAASALSMFEVRHEGMEEAATANICEAIVGAAARIAELEAALRPVAERLRHLTQRHGYTHHDREILRAADRALGDAHG